jgi:hypothetical protein
LTLFIFTARDEVTPQKPDSQLRDLKHQLRRFSIESLKVFFAKKRSSSLEFYYPMKQFIVLANLKESTLFAL